jgi:hypothetical protein
VHYCGYVGLRSPNSRERILLTSLVPSFRWLQRVLSGSPLHELPQARQVDAHAPAHPRGSNLTAGHIAPERTMRKHTILLCDRVAHPLRLYRFFEQCFCILYVVFVAVHTCG